jgi:uncharacterized membrane protein
MIKLAKDTRRFHEMVFLGAAGFFCFGASIFRCLYTGTMGFLFLNWNLFLAFIPWALTSAVMLKPRLQKSKIATVLILLLWLLFFPNAPYIFTDLLHLRRIPLMPAWFDLLMILSFAWTGLLFGFCSLWDIEQLLNEKIKYTYVKAVSAILLFIGSFGVYIGRFLRWNSWDMIAKPFPLLRDIGERVLNPFEHQAAWGMTIFMGLVLNMIYWSFHVVRKSRNTHRG